VSPLDKSTTIITDRLSLVPLEVKDAEEMAGVLGDKRLHEFIGGQPATVAGLRERYARLAAGSPDPDKTWLKWIVRRRSDGQPIGTVQATVTARDGQSTASVAWVIGVDWQNQGSHLRPLERS
jgi:RimJ/RimL family protein N-acetyltransferase